MQGFSLATGKPKGLHYVSDDYVSDDVETETVLIWKDLSIAIRLFDGASVRLFDRPS